MPGRPLPDESTLPLSVYGGRDPARYGGRDAARRREVLRETVAAFEAAPGRYHEAAARNHAAWRAQRQAPPPAGDVRVYAGDWGEVTAALSREHGETFAVLNMANAFVAGGAYVEGAVAQEENMFRRTDCHFAVADDQLA
ncbi:MAG TPA: poly(ADP-ribose) glycohydrolase domain-containing protein, partial [Polyangiaceae bacterium]|nr:poly(ADP-ribose) glycohydrolase domain-containing protein [Polyangiaceae bacterium]